MKFMPNSSALIIIDMENDMFLIKRRSNNDDDIKKMIALERQRHYADYSMIKTNGTINALMLYTKIDGIHSVELSNSHCDYITIHEDTNYTHQIQTIQLTNLYSSIQFQYYDTNKRLLGARMTFIDLLQCVYGENGKIEINIQQTITTIHSFGLIKFTVMTSSILTYGNDGQILLWDKNLMRMVKAIFAHDKYTCGVKEAIFDSLQR